jgi:hypothetical protein
MSDIKQMRLRYFLITALAIVQAACHEPKSHGTTESNKPVIAFDRGHNNWGNRESWALMEDFFSQQGFTVKTISGSFTGKSLEGVDILYINNALAAENIGNWSLPTPSAFSPEEIKRLQGWVMGGGSLLMIIEHMPFAGSFEVLAGAFDIEVSNGFAVDERLLSGYSEEVIDQAGYLVSRRVDGTLNDHPILEGSDPYGRVELLAADVGSAFHLPDHAFPLIELGPAVISLEPDVSWAFDSNTTRTNVEGWSQAGVIEVGKGRIAALGDNFLVIAPVFLDPPYVDSAKDAELGRHNVQFTLNLLHWLAAYPDD